MKQIDLIIKSYIYEERLRKQIRDLVSEEVYRQINEKKEKDKDTKKKKNDNLLRHQVLSLLNQDKIDMAAIGRSIYPRMNDDTRRSLISKYARGERKIPDRLLSQFYDALRNRTMQRK